MAKFDRWGKFDLMKDPWAKFGRWGQRVAWSIELVQPVPNIAGQQCVWYLQDKTLTTAIKQALIRATFRTFHVDAGITAGPDAEAKSSEVRSTDHFTNGSCLGCKTI